MGIRPIARIFGRWINLCIAAYVAMSLAMVCWTFLWPEPELNKIVPADALICLGGGMDKYGVLAESTLNRVDRCVELYRAGLAPVILFTGGTSTFDGPSAAGQMSRYAIAFGLPASAILTENRAHSTLQNALFSLPLIPDAASLIVVTEAFHLPRSWTSIKWAAWELDAQSPSIALVMSEKVRRNRDGSFNKTALFRESIAIWFNALRAIAYSAAKQSGWAEHRLEGLLH